MMAPMEGSTEVSAGHGTAAGVVCPWPARAGRATAVIAPLRESLSKTSRSILTSYPGNQFNHLNHVKQVPRYEALNAVRAGVGTKRKPRQLGSGKYRAKRVRHNQTRIQRGKASREPQCFLLIRPYYSELACHKVAHCVIFKMCTATSARLRVGFREFANRGGAVEEL